MNNVEKRYKEYFKDLIENPPQNRGHEYEFILNICECNT